MKRKNGMPKATFSGVRPHRQMTPEEADEARKLAQGIDISPEAIDQIMVDDARR